MTSRAEQKKQAREARLAAERTEQDAGRRRRRLLTLGGLVAVAAVIVLAAALISQSGTTDERSAPEAVAMLEGIPQDGPWLGPEAAPVVVEEFADPQCPFCAQFATGQMSSIVEEYVRPGQVRMRMRVLTFLGPDSEEAARMAVAAGLQDREWTFMEAFFARQGQENSGYVTDEFLRDVGSEVPGLDVDKALEARTAPEVAARLARDEAAAADSGVQSTPTFLVRRRGGEPQLATADELPAAIDRALGQAA